MLSCVIRGGVGNQMFQIAATYALALNNNDECAFDMDLKRTYHGVVHQGRIASSYFSSLYKNIKQLPLEWKSENKYIEPEGTDYYPIPYKENMMLFGYFQSEKYFEGKGEEIKKLFIDRDLLLDLKNKYQDILYNSVSLHVRRGDYIKFPDVHTILGMDYYEQAICYILNRRCYDHILVFSDDIPWCKDNFEGKAFVFPELKEDWQEIYLMSLCNHNIISNSTFSWWGSYFNENSDKIVIAPELWFNPSANFSHKKIYTEEMVII